MPFARKVVIFGGLSPYTVQAHGPVVEQLQRHFSPQAVHLIGAEWAPYKWGQQYADVEDFLRRGTWAGKRYY